MTAEFLPLNRVRALGALVDDHAPGLDRDPARCRIVRPLRHGRGVTDRRVYLDVGVTALALDLHASSVGVYPYIRNPLMRGGAALHCRGHDDRHCQERESYGDDEVDREANSLPAVPFDHDSRVREW